MTDSESFDWPGRLTYNPRTYTPSDNESEGGTYSVLPDNGLGNGDWSWKPWRYAADPGRVLSDAEIEALYPGREYTPNARIQCGQASAAL